MIYTTIRVLAVLCVVGWFSLFLSQCAFAHEGYPWSCCSGQDCAEAHYGPVQLQDGEYKGWWEVHTKQAKMLFKPDTVLQTFKVNGVPMPGVHACFYKYKSPVVKDYRLGRCLHIGGGT